MLRGGHYREKDGEKEVKKVNMIGVLSIQEVYIYI
jgi:hypothetical protein